MLPLILPTNRGIEWSLRAFARTAFYFASASSDQICLASSEHFVNFPFLRLQQSLINLNVRLFLIVVTKMRSLVRCY